MHLSVGGDAEVAPGRNQAQLIPGAVCPEQRSDTIATRWLVGHGVPTPTDTFGAHGVAPGPAAAPCSRSGSLPRILADQPVHARQADHLTAANCRDHGRSTRRSELQADSATSCDYGGPSIQLGRLVKAAWRRRRSLCSPSLRQISSRRSSTHPE